MNGRNKCIRAQISVMCRERALDYINAFHLPEDEKLYIIEREVDGKSLVEIAREHHTTVEVVRDRRRAGFSRIADAIAYRGEKGLE